MSHCHGILYRHSQKGRDFTTSSLFASSLSIAVAQRLTLTGILCCCTSRTSGYHDAAKKVVRDVDKYPINNGGTHKKYIHMKCGCCKTLFIGCDMIGKSILKSNQWLNQKKGTAELVEVNKKWNNYRWGRIKVHSKHWGKKKYLFYWVR